MSDTVAWRGWLRLLADFPAADFDSATPPRGRVLLEWLLGVHRERLGDLLARGRMEPARRHWDLVHSLPAVARAFRADLAGRLEEGLAAFAGSDVGQCDIDAVQGGAGWIRDRAHNRAVECLAEDR